MRLAAYNELSIESACSSRSNSSYSINAHGYLQSQTGRRELRSAASRIPSVTKTHTLCCVYIDMAVTWDADFYVLSNDSATRLRNHKMQPLMYGNTGMIKALLSHTEK